MQKIVQTKAMLPSQNEITVKEIYDDFKQITEGNKAQYGGIHTKL